MKFLRALREKIEDVIGRWYFVKVMTKDEQKEMLNRASRKVFGEDWKK